MTRQNRQITDGWDRTWGHWASCFPKKDEGSFLEFLYLYKLYPCKLLQPSVSSCIQSLFLILTLIHLHFYIIEYYLNYYWFIFVHLEGSTLREASQRSPVWWVVLARASTAGGRGPQPQFVCWVSTLRSFEHLRTQIPIVFCNAIERWDLQSRLQRPGEMKSSSTLTRLCKDNARHLRRPDLVWHEVVCISDVGKHCVTFTIPFTKTKKQFERLLYFFPVSSLLADSNEAFLAGVYRAHEAIHHCTLAAMEAMDSRSSRSNMFNVRWSTSAPWMVLLRCTMLCTATQLVCTRVTRPTFWRSLSRFIIVS